MAEVVVVADRLREPYSVLNPDARANSLETLAERQRCIAQYHLTESVPHAIRVHFETAKNLYLYAWFVYRFYPVSEKHALATLEFALRERLAPLFPEQFGPDAKRHPTLRTLFAKARTAKLITNSGLRSTERLARQRARNRASMERIREMQERGLDEMAYDDSAIQPLPEDYAHDSLKSFGETLPFIRNEYAHGSFMLHSEVLGTFETVTDMVNELYASGPVVSPLT